jgi:hypothetical protein
METLWKHKVSHERARWGYRRRMRKRSVFALGLMLAVGAVGCGGSTTTKRTTRPHEAAQTVSQQTVIVKPLHALGDKAAAPTETPTRP